MKKYLNKMSEEELVKIFNNIESIRSEIYDICYENNMDYQKELGNIFFGEKYYKYIDIHDYYSSFFLKIKNVIDFFKNISIANGEYLCVKDMEEYEKLYKEARKIYNILTSKCNYGSDKYYENYDKLEKICEKILELLEKELHLLENVDEEQAQEEFIFQVKENNLFEDCYILNNDYTRVFEQINYIKEY